MPFDELDDNCAVWSDGPPPKNWIVGCPVADMLHRQGPPFPDYTGWVDYGGLREIAIYGGSKGIRFSYKRDRPDRIFGDVSDATGVLVQELMDGEKPVGIALLDPYATEDQNEITDDASIDTASSVAEPSVKGQLYVSSVTRILDPQPLVFNSPDTDQFITDKNEDRTPPHPFLRHYATPMQLRDCIAGCKFDFTSSQLINWVPIWEARRPGLTRQALYELIHYKWNHRPDNVRPDASISSSAMVASIFFDENASGAVDAVKGFVTNEGRFCGLIVRRAGLWVESVFGQRSAYERTFELQAGEFVTGIACPEINGRPSPEALAICTNHGRSSPWFGISARPGTPYKYRRAPAGHVAVGLFGVLSERPYFFCSYLWDEVGILYRARTPSDGPPSPELPPEPPLGSAFHWNDPKTGLPWLSDCTMPAEQSLYLQPLLAQNWDCYQENENVGRAYCVWDPEQLLQVRVCCNSKGDGIRAIRFKGTPAMGIVTIGEWPAEEVKLKSRDKMRIDGPNGEYVTWMRVVLQDMEQGDKIACLSLETSRGRRREFSSGDMQGTINAKRNARTIEFTGSDQVVGLHGIVSVRLLPLYLVFCELRG